MGWRRAIPGRISCRGHRGEVRRARSRGDQANERKSMGQRPASMQSCGHVGLYAAPTKGDIDEASEYVFIIIFDSP